MTLAERFAPKHYRLRQFTIERTETGIDAYLVVEVLTDTGRGIDTIRLPVTLTAGEKTVLRQKITDRLAQFDLDEALTEATDEPGP